MGQNRTIVHLVRHGEVHNPAGLLYGRLPDYHLSGLGKEMAERVAEYFRDRDIVQLRSSPLERAQETAAPIAEAFNLPVVTDPRVIEAANYFEGLRLSFDGALRHPKYWRYFRNPYRPTWGEPYRDILARMRPAMRDAASAALGHEAVIVSHQLPIWIGDEGKGRLQGLLELLQRHRVIRGDGQDLAVELLDVRVPIPVRRELAGSTRCERLREEGHDDRAALHHLRQRVRPAVGVCHREIRCCLACLRHGAREEARHQDG